MTLRQHRFIIGLCCIAGSLLVSLALQNIPPSLGWNAAYAATSTLADPVSDPGGFLSQLLSFAHTNIWLALGLGLYAVLEVTILLGKNVPALQKLDKGRITLVIAGVFAVLGTALDVAMRGGNLQAVFVAAIAAVAAYWHPAQQKAA